MRDNCDGEDFHLPMMVALALGPAGQRKAMAGRCDGEDGVELRSQDGECARSVVSEGNPREHHMVALELSPAGGKRDGEGWGTQMLGARR